MAQLAVSPSPFGCRWITRGTEMRLDRWTYAVCVRRADQPRVVSEDECSRCACWQSSSDERWDVPAGRGEAPGAFRV